MTELKNIFANLLDLAEMLDSGAIKKKSAARKIFKIAKKLDKVILNQVWRDIKTIPYGHGPHLTYHRDWGYGLNGEQMINGQKPTHWQPLPAPPPDK